MNITELIDKLENILEEKGNGPVIIYDPKENGYPICDIIAETFHDYGNGEKIKGVVITTCWGK